MNRFFRAIFAPLVLVVVLVWMATSASSVSLSSLLGALLPFLLLAGFWAYIVMTQRKRRGVEPGSQNQVREFQGNGFAWTLARSWAVPVIAIAVMTGIAWSKIGPWAIAVVAVGLFLSTLRSGGLRVFRISKSASATPAGATVYEKQFALTLPHLRRRPHEPALSVQPESTRAQELEARIGLGN